MNRIWGTALVAVIAAAALTGCGPAKENEQPCKDFEATYNRLDLQDKRNVTVYYAEFGSGIRELSGVASAGAEKASGDTKSKLKNVSDWIGLYQKSKNLTESATDGQNIFDAAASVSKACSDSGFPIHLNPASTS